MQDDPEGAEIIPHSATDAPSEEALPALVSTQPKARIGLEELFDRDPNSWTRDDRVTIVGELRQNRHRWNTAEQVKLNKPKETKAKAPALALGADDTKPTTSKAKPVPTKSLKDLSAEDLFG